VIALAISGLLLFAIGVQTTGMMMTVADMPGQTAKAQPWPAPTIGLEPVRR
jgi:hypothetical protein